LASSPRRDEPKPAQALAPLDENAVLFQKNRAEIIYILMAK